MRDRNRVSQMHRSKTPRAENYPIGQLFAMATTLLEDAQELARARFEVPRFEKLILDGGVDVEEQERWDRYLRMAASPATAAAMTSMLLEVDLRDVLRTVRVPTLVLRTSSPFSTVASKERPSREASSTTSAMRGKSLPSE